MRGIARPELGLLPPVTEEAERIRRFLSFREDCDATSVLDPCAGGGAAMATITSGAKTLTYGIELDSFRAEAAVCSSAMSSRETALMSSPPSRGFHCSSRTHRYLSEFFRMFDLNNSRIPAKACL